MGSCKVICVLAVLSQAAALLTSPPRMLKQPPSEELLFQVIQPGEADKPFIIECEAEGEPAPKYRWVKNGKPFEYTSYDNRISQQPGRGTLVVSQPRNEDMGQYQCFAWNEWGTATSNSVFVRKAELNSFNETDGAPKTVAAPEGKPFAAPFFIEEPQFLNMVEGEKAVIRCKAGGTPNPQISWIHNGQPIEYAEPNDRRQVTADSIIISDLSKKDTGNYGCNATNSVGYVYKDVYINVQTIPPEIKEGPEDLVKVDGSTAVMKCRVFGAPRPVVKWMRDDVDVTGGKYNITSEGDLVIRDVSFADVGMYQCYAKNKIGVKSAFGSLNVKKRTVITDKPEHYEVAAGSPATFRCNAHADDSLNLTMVWLNDGVPVDFDSQPRFRMTNDYSLLISDTTELDSGEYTCIAKTQIDEARAQATLTVQDKPNPPEITGLECHRSVAIIKWRDMDRGDNRAITLRYTIQYNTTFTPDTWDVASDSVPSADHTWTVQLSPWSNYTFRVIAWNKIGPSAPSGHSEVCTTQPDVPYKNPDKVEGRGTDPTNMVISWSKMPQIEHNGPGFYYLVSWRRNITGQPWNEEIIRDWQQTEYIVHNTPTFVPYRIKVIAVNSKGTSNVAPVEVTGWSGEDIPLQAPSNFTLVQITAGTTALLSWNPVPPESLRGHFKGYKIQTWTDGDEENLKEILVKADATSTLVSKFKPFKKNNARIMAYNGRYNGPPSEVISFVTPEGKPGTVKSFEAHPIGSSAMLLKWDKPVDENGILTGYKIYYQKATGTALGPLQERKKEIDPKFDRAKLAGLEPNTKYRIEIRAKTKAGEGDKYYIEQSTRAVVNAKPDVPVFTAHTQATKEGNPHILVRWHPTSDGHAGTHFTAWYRLKGRDDWAHTSEVTEDDYVVLTGLEPGQVYEVKISAHDGEYFSFSELKDVDTTLDGPVIMRDDTMAHAGWFIGVMLALAFLLLVLVLVCVVRRNRGGKYDVHDRELAHGRRDYADAGFHEYTHPIEPKSRHSMSSGTKPGPESDTDSMAEYGEGETAGMNEDGSFIGQYGRKRRAPAASQSDSASQAFATLV